MDVCGPLEMGGSAELRVSTPGAPPWTYTFKVTLRYHKFLPFF